MRQPTFIERLFIIKKVIGTGPLPTTPAPWNSIPNMRRPTVVVGLPMVVKRTGTELSLISHRGLEVNPKDADAYHMRGFVYTRKGDWDRAIADFTRALELKPKYAAAHSDRAFVYYQKGDWDRAIGDYTRALELDPKDGQAYRGRGFAYGRKRTGTELR